MRILHIWDSDYPWDIRVEKINDTFVENGHEVFLVCRNDGRNKLKELHRGIMINRLPYLPKQFGLLNSMIGFPVFFSPLWKYYTLKVAKQNKIDLIVVRDLPLVLLALWLGKKIQKPVILDMAENYPLMLESILENSPSVINYIIRNPKAARMVENIAFKRLDKIFVVIEESYERLVKHGVRPEKIKIVRNTPAKSLYLDAGRIPLPEDDFFKNDNKLVLLYNGLTNPSRGVSDFICVLPEIVEKFPNIKFVIIGKGKDDEKIWSQIKKLKLKEIVFHKGWVSHEDKKKYLAHCDIGIIPYRITTHWNTTIPNKLFDYMCMKKPVLSTCITPTARIISESECGFVYNRDDINDLCKKIEMLSDRKIRESLGSNGYSMILSKYNWDIDKQNILSGIGDVTSQYNN